LDNPVFRQIGSGPSALDITPIIGSNVLFNGDNLIFAAVSDNTPSAITIFNFDYQYSEIFAK